MLCPQLLVFSSCILFFGQLSYLKFHLKLWHFSHWRFSCRLDVSTCAKLVQIFSGIQTIRGLLNHLHIIVTILLVIYNCYNIYIYRYLQYIYICIYIYIYNISFMIIIYILDTKKTNSCFLWKSLSMWHWSFYGKKTVDPGFPAPKRPSFSSFPTTSWCGNWTENSGPFSALAAGPGLVADSLGVRMGNIRIHVRTGKKHIEKHDDVTIC